MNQLLNIGYIFFERSSTLNPRVQADGTERVGVHRLDKYCGTKWLVPTQMVIITPAE